jgi:hypothetical protein
LQPSSTNCAIIRKDRLNHEKVTTPKLGNRDLLLSESRDSYREVETLAVKPNETIRLAHALRQRRELTWPGPELTQAQLAKQAATNPPTLPVTGICPYAKFFCTEGSLEGEPHLAPEDQLSSDEKDRFKELESRLLRLLSPKNRKARLTLSMSAARIAPGSLDQLAEERGGSWP